MKSSIVSVLFAGCVALCSVSAPAADYVVTTGPAGIYSLLVNKYGVAPVTGNPFAPIPVPGGQFAQPQPSFIAMDSAGEYLYALYNNSYDEILWSFRMINGVPYQINSATTSIYKNSVPVAMAVTKHFVFVVRSPWGVYGSLGNMQVFVTTNGVLSLYDRIDFGSSLGSTWITFSPTSIQVDPQEWFAYVTYASGPFNPTAIPQMFGNCYAAQCVAIYSISGLLSGIQATLWATVPQANGLLVGAQ